MRPSRSVAAMGRAKGVAVIVGSSPVVETVLIVVIRAVLVVLHCRSCPARRDNVESLGPTYPWYRGTLGLHSLLSVPVGCLGIFEDVDEVLALRRWSEDKRGPRVCRAVLTVLMIFPELLMIVIVSWMGIVPVVNAALRLPEAPV